MIKRVAGVRGIRTDKGEEKRWKGREQEGKERREE
jgi:hypothetical protein